jgi:hypothetical protein
VLEMPDPMSYLFFTECLFELFKWLSKSFNLAL